MKIQLNNLIKSIENIKIGQNLLISGTIWTVRDAAHKKISEMLSSGRPAPFDLKHSAIYYCGPTPAKPNAVVGACGPTTSSRMDFWTPQFLKYGVKVLIGKGARSQEVVNSIKENKALYLAATGGVAALLSKAVKKCSLYAFEDLGTEAIYKLEVNDFPLIVAVDSFGNNLFDRGHKNG
jgi:fumarate hydratase subunit beta